MVPVEAESHSDQRENHVRFCRELAEFAGDPGFGVDRADDADRQVSQHGHHPRARFGSNLRAILVERHVAHQMASRLDGPVPPVQCEQLGGAGPLGRKAGDEERDVVFDFTSTAVLADPFDLRDLKAVREVRESGQIGARPDAARLDSAVRFFVRFMLRGE